MSIIRTHRIYVAPFIDENVNDDGSTFPLCGEPFAIDNVILNSVRSQTDIQQYGSDTPQMKKMLVDYDRYIGKIQPNDLLYLYGVTPEKEMFHGQKANYVVVDVMEQNLKIMIYMKKRNMKWRKAIG